MFRLLTAGATALAAVAIAAPAQARPNPVPDQRMTIGVVNAIGSGCPDKTARIAVSPDNTAFTVTYSEYTAQVGPEASPLDFRKNCQLALDVKVPTGFTFAIASADYRGYASLARGAWAMESANYYFQGHATTTRFEHRFTGPFSDDWQRGDQVGIASLSFLPCGERRYLNINTDLRVNRGTSDARKETSFISMDSTDAAINTVYHVAWRQCR
ncbi:hypothetical protein Acy02nite_08860 [Actinoplanes cyaneus]|uniref:DUF4360 domain-containing protein n=1 Tax=Actinoplanes cyaneus TaxID=52696 RepID=A0A919LYH4_9ACTN|nr:DUF4360 domain-containing protein [Actinoplanes cyaneus]MCW2135633.1 protein of unknown function (DUF4360) [Actinoplanes cyaneus]GID63005.1 hypothetical protein Acy02nite_08860 [Actinoplanes cyaneus]